MPLSFYIVSDLSIQIGSVSADMILSKTLCLSCDFH